MLINKITSLVQKLNIFVNHIFFNNFDEKNFIKNIAKDNFIFFDVGSNLGTYTNFFMKSAKEFNLEIHSFEPNTNLINQQKNSFKNKKKIIFNNFALGEIEGTSDLHITKISSQSSFDTKYIENKSDIKKIETVSVKTLDRYCEKNKIDYINFLKIDCEGFDLNVLKGATRLLSNNKIKFIKIETNFNSNIYNMNEISNFLSLYNYKIFAINNQKYLNNKLNFADIFFVN